MTFVRVRSERLWQAEMLALQSEVCVSDIIMEIKGNFNFKPRDEETKQGWYSRGYLPHFDGGETAQFITARLFDSMPQEVLENWRDELKTQNADKTETDAIFRKRVEAYLDQGDGSCFLRDERVANVVKDALLFHDEKKYQLRAWVIMPNHIHILLTPNAGFALNEIVHSIKSFTANEANKILNRKGIFWQHESFDRYIRNAEHFANVIKYIENNPVKAKLCVNPEDWKFSSAFGLERKHPCLP